MSRVRHGLWLLVERALTWCVHPYLRARLLGLMGADVGRGVRIYEARFFNLVRGFRNLVIEPDVHIGTGCLIDLADEVHIKKGSVLSPRVIVLTHADPGEDHGSPLIKRYPKRNAPVVVGPYAWIGAGAVLLCGVEVGEESVVGANSVVTSSVAPREVVAGSPARPVGGSKSPVFG